ncbi:hypothetical protein BM525_19310 (plasmid) [Alteromonas mediterranea]|uniref:Uncharacterized protein n=1 Tax=Alteromonas mediterranea TaxID=314275 RepID=A0AAC9JE59_9ALTE|nr:hypothetical protein [Alteromonas mediterranea]APD92033.1 hypothetical protein BM524_19115 [Alteromonas mediterranea]APD99887.1 hypothetical protein BM525_19310 [Alteromonas mediterranea]
MKTTITEHELNNAVHAVGESLKNDGVNLSPESLCELNDTLHAFLTEKCALEIMKPSNGTHPCPHCGVELAQELNVKRTYVNKDGGDDIAVLGHYEGDDQIFEADEFYGLPEGRFDCLDDSDQCESCGGQL